MHSRYYNLAAKYQMNIGMYFQLCSNFDDIEIKPYINIYQF